jgi:hypothetical protein
MLFTLDILFVPTILLEIDEEDNVLPLQETLASG